MDLALSYEHSKLILDLSTFVVGVALMYLQATILPMRHTCVYVALELVHSAFMAIARFGMTDIQVNLLTNIVFLLLPWPFWRASIPTRFAASFSACAAVFFSEAVCAVVWILFTGTPTADYTAAVRNLPGSIALRLFDIALIMACAKALRCLFARFGTYDKASDRTPPQETDAPFALFIAVQTILVMASSFVISKLNNDSLVLFCTLAALSLLAECSVLAVHVAWRRAREERIARLKSEMLDAQLREYLAQCDQDMRELADAARLRHDLRNHIQVAGMLIERNELEHAARYIDEMATSLAKDDACTSVPLGEARHD